MGPMVQHTLENEKTMKKMGEERKPGRTTINIPASLSKIRNKEKALLNFMMALLIRENLKMATCRGKEPLFGLTVDSIVEVGLRIRLRGKDVINGVMEELIRGRFKMIKNMDLGRCTMLMGQHFLASGKKI
jgi:hypothetical protein